MDSFKFEIIILEKKNIDLCIYMFEIRWVMQSQFWITFDQHLIKLLNDIFKKNLIFYYYYLIYIV